MAKEKKNINWWPYGIIAAFAIFAGGMIRIIVLFSSHDIDLVVEDYYDAEIAYQNQIDQNKNALDLSEQVKVKLMDARTIYIQLPSNFDKNKTQGKLLFYRPSDGTKDFSVDLKLNDENAQYVDITEKLRGRWVLKAQWQSLDESYYLEKDLNFN